jgi:alkanesulfonate monooxygenase SsuD/methylene tetrahydromethanopterin reductase-like flavin-dependent oxidoreductase (luciferase family)
MDEQIATMRRIWAGEPPFEGADPVGPPPVQAGGPPFIGGSMGPKSVARAARWADGVDGAWTLDGDQQAMATSFDMVRAAWRDAGRSEAPHLSTSFWYALGPDAEERLRKYAYDYMLIFGEDVAKWAASAVTLFTPEAVRQAVENVRATGADELFFVPTTADPDELSRTRDALGI